MLHICSVIFFLQPRRTRWARQRARAPRSWQWTTRPPSTTTSSRLTLSSSKWASTTATGPAWHLPSLPPRPCPPRPHNDSAHYIDYLETKLFFVSLQIRYFQFDCFAISPRRVCVVQKKKKRALIRGELLIGYIGPLRQTAQLRNLDLIVFFFFVFFFWISLKIRDFLISKGFQWS